MDEEGLGGFVIVGGGVFVEVDFIVRAVRNEMISAVFFGKVHVCCFFSLLELYPSEDVALVWAGLPCVEHNDLSLWSKTSSNSTYPCPRVFVDGR